MFIILLNEGLNALLKKINLYFLIYFIFFFFSLPFLPSFGVDYFFLLNYAEF